MAIILGNGSSIEGGSSAFRLRNSSGTNVFEQGVATYGGQNYGYYNNTSVPMFSVMNSQTGTDPGWTTVTAGGWYKASTFLDTPSVNRGSHYSTVNTRFTAPVTGQYMFIYSAYMYSGSYSYGSFGVNGSTVTRHGTDTKYRIRNHGFVANYQFDMQMEEVVYLTAGDYVEPFLYGASGTSTYHYPRYGLFSGAFVG